MIVDAAGSAARPPLAFDSKPVLLTQGGMCIVSGKYPLIIECLRDSVSSE